MSSSPSSSPNMSRSSSDEGREAAPRGGLALDPNPRSRAQAGPHRRDPTPVVKRCTPTHAGVARNPVSTAEQRRDVDARAVPAENASRRDNLVSSMSGSRCRFHRPARVSFGPRGTCELAWYERLMPDFFLNMTAPLTGYEPILDSDVEDEEYEILERQRLKRNRRIRRRLITMMLLAGAAGLFMYYRGRVLRRVGVRAAMCTMKHRIEDGLAKSIHETMGK